MPVHDRKFWLSLARWLEYLTSVYHTISLVRIDKDARQRYLITMPHPFDVFISSFRHLLVAAAILATLTSTFGVHGHQSVPEHHQHAVGKRCLDDHDGHNNHDAQNSHDGHNHAHQSATQIVVSKFTGNIVSGECDSGTNGNSGDKTPSDPDGCGHCHCPAPSSMPPAAPPFVADFGFTRLVHRSHNASIPDGVTYQPDPPPAKG
jgi:hypothetical protein